MSTDLDVWWGSTPVATVTTRRGQMTMVYASAESPMLTVAMPPRTRPYGQRQARPFFHGLLPEGEARTKIAYDLGLGNTGGDDTDLLGAIGRDCAGALVVVPEGTTPPSQSGATLAPLTDAEVGQRLRDVSDHPLGVDHRVRLSLPGVQHKLLLARTADGAWHLPLDGTPSTHILKPQLPRWPGSVDNEVLCQAIAAEAEVPAAITERMVFDGQPVLVSTRFDRDVRPDGTVYRLHQEDLCQALSVLTVPLERKYQTASDHQPSFRGAADVLDRWGETGARYHLVDQMAINAILGNADLHGKNLSFVHRDDHLELSPAFDILSTTALDPTLSTSAGMLIANESDIHRITPADLVDEATSWGLPRQRAAARIEALLERLPTAIEAAADRFPVAPDALVAHLHARAERARTAVAAHPGGSVGHRAGKPAP